MRSLSTCALLIAFCTAPAFCQTTATLISRPAPKTAAPASSPAAAAKPAPVAEAPAAEDSDPSVDYATLREEVSRQNKALADEVVSQRAIVKKNQELMKETQKLQAQNVKLAEERKKLQTMNAELEKQRQSLKASQKSTEPN